MRNLKRGLFLLPFLTLLIAVLALSSAGSAAADSLGSKRFQESTVELVVSVTPLNVAPGQQATVTIALKNVSPGPIAPEVTILLPASVSTRMNELPSGTIYNAQSGTLSWQPIIAGDGSELRLTLPIIAQVASNQAPEQTVTVLVQSGGAELKQDAKFWIGLAPTASIKLNPPQVAVGQLIQFVGEVSGPVPVAQLWSLGDGRIVEAENPSVFYPYPGAYEVVFQASTPLGVISQRTVVNVVPQAIARFAMSDNTPAVGVPVQFSNESGGQQPLSYLWDFGDGGISTETQPAHTYQAPGTYDVRLYVTGANGQSESIQTVKVGSTPVADFIIGGVVDAGSVIQGQAFADDSATSITWDMGDGRVHEGSAIQHVYWAAGDYPVIVTVANEFGETRMVRSVRVNPGPRYLYLPLIHQGLDAAAAPAQPPDQQEQAETPLPVIGEEELPLLELGPELNAQQQLLAYINEARRLNGLPALNPVPELSAAAQSHTDDMAQNGFTSHAGSDGSVPALRVMLSGYPGGYAGEATAWGMAQAVEAVRFWLTSPAHRTIILNPSAKDVGVAFSENFDAPSVWYWTAEFASLDLPVVEVPLPPSMTPPAKPVITLLGPPTNGEFMMIAETKLSFTWSWSQPLSADERFGVYLNSQGRTIQLGTVNVPQSGDQYHFATTAGNVPALPGQRSWYVRLEDTLTGELREQSEERSIIFIPAP
ncbi:MAG: PKD domain-containing protein [Chloroflexota bacterium]|jgi:uncharacterized protein YkwD